MTHRSRVVIVWLLEFALSVGADPVDDLIKREMDRYRIPGLVLAIAHRGGPDDVRTYGLANVELNVPVSSNTVFEIGSLTKQFTSAGILLLVEEGKLSLDDRISRYFSGIPSAWSNITVRHLLNHTSGIRNYTGHDGFEMTKRLTQAQFIQAIGALPMDFAPGTRSKYCNSGYNLLGYIIENVSSQSYWDFLGQRIWGPLEMRAATHRDPAIVVPHRAAGYVRRNGVLRNRDNDLTDVFAAGAMISTIGDLLKWNDALETNRILNMASRGLMWTAGKLNDGATIPYGFGWRIGEFEGWRNIGHSGSTAGFSASLQRFPEEGLAVIVLCNLDEANIATTLARELAKLCLPKKSPAH